ncbi:MAG: RNA 2',3'-cyclic phosphodiesterase [Candidatus Bathyarchaeota archaeon]|nr:RNA 2',3'-cyclic phosphodiesterase [Candidatus Bathyarchaeota archaeon]MDH5780001.1 RNA 2',3'-cyclic phosphodiesterase [Candidatus Bathyarchaeota archaeon]
MPETIRSFIAFDIDNKAVLRELSKAQDKLVNTGANLKLVKPQNIHVTMRFLGNIHPTMINSIHQEMESVSFTPFDVELTGLGVFPNPKYIRVVWAGINKGADELRDIFDQLEPRLRKLGFKPDRKGFSPHLTIARVRTAHNKAELMRCIEELADHELGVLRADCLRLKRSVLTPKGPIYSMLKEVCH